MAIAFNTNSSFAGNFGNTGATGDGRLGTPPNLGPVNAGTYQIAPAPTTFAQFFQQMLKAFSSLLNNWQGINMPLSQVAQLPVRDDIREAIDRRQAIAGQRAHPPTKQEIASFEKQFDFIPGRQRYPEGFGWTQVENGVLYNSQGVPIGKVRPEYAHQFPPTHRPPVYSPPVSYQPPPVYQFPATPPPPPVATPQGGYR